MDKLYCACLIRSMKNDQMSLAVRSGAAFGYETGFSQAVSYFREAASKLDGDPERKVLILSMIESIEEFGLEDRVKFVKALEIKDDGAILS